SELRWVRIDPEYLDRTTPQPARPNDLRPGEFLDASEAWRLVRSGGDDPLNFGVFGTENWGVGEIRGNVLRDLASLAVKVEMLPWDEWGPMADSYHGRTATDFDDTIDAVATAVRRLDHVALQHHYDELAVPAAMLH
ncbi:MAG: transglutaminase, partial [Aquihabitans sp.]